MTFDALQFRIYVDGTNVATSAETSANSQGSGGNGANRWTIGAENQRSVPGMPFVNYGLFGWVANVTCFRSAIDAATVLQLYEAGSTNSAIAVGTGESLWTLDFRNGSFLSVTPSAYNGVFSQSFPQNFDSAIHFASGPGPQVTNTAAALVSTVYPLMTEPSGYKGSMLASATNLAFEISSDGSNFSAVAMSSVLDDPVSGYKLLTGSCSTGANVSTSLVSKVLFPTNAAAFLRAWSRQVE